MKNLKPGDHCIVQSEETGKYDRPTAVITDVLKGRDRFVRTVEMKLPHSAVDINHKGLPLKLLKIRRAIESIILLEASVEETTK